MNTDLAQLACDRYEIADTLHRYAFGLDHGDADSLASAFAEDCIFDFRPAGIKLGIDFPKLSGREAIVNALFHSSARSTPVTRSAISKSRSVMIPPYCMPTSCLNISCREKVAAADQRMRF